MKSSQALQTIAINLAWRGATLVAEFSRGFFKGRLRVTKAVAAIRAGKLPVDEDSHTGFASTGAGFVRREYARCRGGNNQGFRFREKTKRDTNRLMLRPKEGSFAVERINEDAPQSCSGKREKTAEPGWVISNMRWRLRNWLGWTARWALLLRRTTRSAPTTFSSFGRKRRRKSISCRWRRGKRLARGP